MSGVEGSSVTERATLRQFLDYQREALISAVQGLTDEQSRMTPTARSLSLLSLIAHSAIWERRWFRVVVAGRRSRRTVRPAVQFDQNVRSVAIHMIAETARHVGHADIIRETIDGTRAC
jgi:hypothetical protein